MIEATEKRGAHGIKLPAGVLGRVRPGALGIAPDEFAP
jgi:hypothetical protein